jgi:hypothetical protein
VSFVPLAGLEKINSKKNQLASPNSKSILRIIFQGFMCGEFRNIDP